MFTTTQEAIIESVYDGDDAALYALADHYEEEGDPARAEFVRVQGQLDGRMITHHQEMSLAQRQDTLLTEHRDRWLDCLPRLPGIEYEFARGLPRAVAEDGNALRRGIEVLAMCADVRAVRLDSHSVLERAGLPGG